MNENFRISKKLDQQGGNPLLLNPKVKKKRSGFIAKIARQKQIQAREANRKISLHLEFNKVIKDNLVDQKQKTGRSQER